MNDLVTINNGAMITNSKIVFEHFSVSGGHRYIMSRINDLINTQPEFGAQHFFRSSYTSPQNKVLKCFDMTRDGFSLVAMSLSGKKALDWKIKFINAFNEMEKGTASVDREMTRLSNQGKSLKQMGSDWSSFGHQINRQKKDHDQSVKALISEVQYKLAF